MKKIIEHPSGHVALMPYPILILAIYVGAHTIGRSHCSSFRRRLYNFNSTVSQDPSLDPDYAAFLKRQCPQGSNDTSVVVPLDPWSPDDFDTNYYNNILDNRGLLTSDQTLGSDNATACAVRQNALDAELWKGKFSQAMVKMSQIGVITGSDGEIRKNCRVIN